MHDTFAAYIERPSIRRYKEVRRDVLACEGYAEFNQCLAHAEQLELDNHIDDALHAYRSLMPLGVLSLRLHRVAGAAELRASELGRGDANRALLHRSVYAACCETILATGLGTKDRPFLITYASDARELLFAKSEQVISQSCIKERRRRYDVLLTSGEREFWFDVTDLVAVPVVSRVRRPVPVVAATRAGRRKPRAVSHRT